MDMRWGHPVCALDIGCDQGIQTLFLDFRWRGYSLNFMNNFALFTCHTCACLSVYSDMPYINLLVSFQFFIHMSKDVAPFTGVSRLLNWAVKLRSISVAHRRQTGVRTIAFCIYMSKFCQIQTPIPILFLGYYLFGKHLLTLTRIIRMFYRWLGWWWH